jgi:uncharacterized protein (DUF3820 family)
MTDKEALATIMPFGKYKGKTLEDIGEENPTYISWMLDNINFTTEKLFLAVKKAYQLYEQDIREAEDTER